jgi:thiopurine S-methyltransferase
MEEQFWHDRWKTNQIAFHKAEANPLLVRNFPALGLAAGSRVFVPLCGKSLDLHWLLAQGYRVAGAELSRLAVEQLFAELGVEPRITEAGSLTRFEAEGIVVYQGSLFELTRERVGPADAVYDRAALVALPEPMRSRYVPHVMDLTAHARQLLICFEYDKRCMDGPPFSVEEPEVRRRYEGVYDVRQLERGPGETLRGICPSVETVWVLEPRAGE